LNFQEQTLHWRRTDKEEMTGKEREEKVAMNKVDKLLEKYLFEEKVKEIPNSMWNNMTKMQILIKLKSWKMQGYKAVRIHGKILSINTAISDVEEIIKKKQEENPGPA